MNAIVPFDFKGQQVRTDLIDGQVVFAASDVCSILGYANARDAIAKHCRAKGVAKRDTLTSGGKQSLTYISEGNLYRLITGCNLPGADEFESWVFDEVIPTIRKTGAYVAPKVAKPAALMREARSVLSDSMKVAKLLGFDGNQAKIRAMQVTKAKTGVDVAELFEVKLIAETQAMHLSPTLIGLRLRPAQTPNQVNQLLVALGAQVKEDGAWVGAESHREHWEYKDDPRKHTTGSVRSLRWFPSIVPLIQAQLPA